MVVLFGVFCVVVVCLWDGGCGCVVDVWFYVWVGCGMIGCYVWFGLFLFVYVVV